jgi:cell division protein FtsL
MINEHANSVHFLYNIMGDKMNEILIIVGMLVSLISIMTPILKLDSSITKLNDSVDTLTNKVDEIEKKNLDHDERITKLECVIGDKK